MQTPNEEDARQVTDCDLLLIGGIVITVDDERRVIEDGAVAITADRIVAIGRATDLEVRAARTVDCAGKVVLPGFIDTHNHLFQGLARGLGNGLDIWSWLSRFMWPYAGTISREESEISAFLGVIEAARAGTTALLDHHYGCTDVETTLAVASAIESVGLRGVVARGIAGPITEIGRAQSLPERSFVHSAEEEIELTAACMDARPAGGQVAVWPGPINITYTDRDLLRSAAALAQERGTGWHTHFCAPRVDPGLFAEAYGTRPAEWLRDEGMLGPDTTLAHAIWVDDHDISLLGASNSCVAHCPLSNMSGGSGVMPLRALRNAGVTVGLGTDGSAGSHRQDMLETMKLTMLLHRSANADSQAVGSPETLALATVEGAKVLQIDAGQLVPGKLADVTIVDLRAPHAQPLLAPIENLVNAAHATDVWMTIVGGRVIYEGGRSTLVDEAAVVAEASERARDLIKRAGIDLPRASDLESIERKSLHV